MAVKVTDILGGGGVMVEPTGEPKILTGSQAEDDLARDIRRTGDEVVRAVTRTGLVRKLLGDEKPPPQFDGFNQMAQVVTTVLTMMKDMPGTMQAQYKVEMDGLRQRMEELKGARVAEKSPIETWREVQGLLDTVLDKTLANQPKPQPVAQASDLPVLLELKKVEMGSNLQIVQFQSKQEEERHRWETEREERNQRWKVEQDEKHRRWKVEDEERAENRKLEYAKMEQSGANQAKAVEMFADLAGAAVDGIGEGEGLGVAGEAPAPRARRPRAPDGPVMARRVAIQCREPECDGRVELPEGEAQPGATVTCPKCKTEYRLEPERETPA